MVTFSPEIKLTLEQCQKIEPNTEYVVVNAFDAEGNHSYVLWPKDYCPECDGRNYQHVGSCKQVE